MVKQKLRWTKDVVDRILDKFPNEEVYTFASGVSPSGVVHFGNFRDIMTCVPLVEEMNERGFKTRFILSWDDFDRFRKVPQNIPSSFEKYIGMPLSDIPDPENELPSYARRFEIELEEALEELEIDIEYIYQSEKYKNGEYNGLIIHAIENRQEIAKILLSLMSEKGKKNKNIDEEKYIQEFYPISIYSSFSGKDNTKILDIEETRLEYRCLDTNKEEVIDLKNCSNVKLPWKVDWPMRWKFEGVNFEPGGHDHASPGSSFDAASRIAKKIFDIHPPVFIEYDLIGLQGLAGRMSSSTGTAISPKNLLRIYTPEMLKWLYTRKKPNQKFDLAFDTEIFRQYDEYDKQHGIENSISFRQAVAFGQILQWDLNKIYELLDRLGENYDKQIVEERVKRAKHWLEEYNPDSKIEIRDSVNTKYISQMSSEEKDMVKKLKDFLEKNNNPTIEELTEILYAIPREGYEDDKKQMKERQKTFFKHLYNLLISQDQGPRLATFLYAVDREEILKLLDI